MMQTGILELTFKISEVLTLLNTADYGKENPKKLVLSLPEHNDKIIVDLKLNGTIVKHIEQSTGIIDIDTSSLTDGVYTMSVQSILTNNAIRVIGDYTFKIDYSFSFDTTKGDYNKLKNQRVFYFNKATTIDSIQMNITQNSGTLQTSTFTTDSIDISNNQLPNGSYTLEFTPHFENGDTGTKISKDITVDETIALNTTGDYSKDNPKTFYFTLPEHNQSAIAVIKKGTTVLDTISIVGNTVTLDNTKLVDGDLVLEATSTLDNGSMRSITPYTFKRDYDFRILNGNNKIVQYKLPLAVTNIKKEVKLGTTVVATINDTLDTLNLDILKLDNGEYTLSSIATLVNGDTIVADDYTFLINEVLELLHTFDYGKMNPKKLEYSLPDDVDTITYTISTDGTTAVTKTQSSGIISIDPSALSNASYTLHTVATLNNEAIRTTTDYNFLVDYTFKFNTTQGDYNKGTNPRTIHFIKSSAASDISITIKSGSTVIHTETLTDLIMDIHKLKLSNGNYTIEATAILNNGDILGPITHNFIIDEVLSFDTTQGDYNKGTNPHTLYVNLPESNASAVFKLKQGSTVISTTNLASNVINLHTLQLDNGNYTIEVISTLDNTDTRGPITHNFTIDETLSWDTTRGDYTKDYPDYLYVNLPEDISNIKIEYLHNDTVQLTENQSIDKITIVGKDLINGTLDIRVTATLTNNATRGPITHHTNFDNPNVLPSRVDYGLK